MKSSVTKKHNILKAAIKALIFSALRRFTLQFLVFRKVSQKNIYYHQQLRTQEKVTKTLS